MHTNELYNTLLTLSRNLFFYNKIRLNDTFESILNTLTLEEIIALKLELSSSYINNRLYNIIYYIMQ